VRYSRIVGKREVIRLQRFSSGLTVTLKQLAWLTIRRFLQNIDEENRH